MKSTEVNKVRTSLGLTQSQFASLLGVHALTVSKWERGVLEPSAYQAALIESFAKSAKKRPAIGAAIGGVLLAAGVGMALFTLLEVAYGGPRPKRRRPRRKAA